MEKDSTLWKEEEAKEIKERIIAALEQVIDPELGIDIVNLGLVYNVHLYGNGFCQIDLTLTTMGCPLVDVITDDIINALKTISEVTSSEVKLVWYPAWDTTKMSRYARIALGIR
ncbi:MAG: metal-sulfur cluster assembly factor [Carnobacterium sp.]|nr:metal-sulfur cluster assembly factor [Carnobacterium sp.]